MRSDAARWTLDASRLASSRGLSLADRIGALVVLEIERGRLPPGSALPGSRVLAEVLGVDRQTVQRALASLVAEGWLATVPRCGTFVASELPARSLRRSDAPRSSSGRAGFPFHAEGDVDHDARSLEHDLSTGIPDVRLLPRTALARAYAAVLRSGARSRLTYGDPRGEVSLRRALRSMLADTRALAIDEDGILVTHGSQHGLDLAARALIRPGDRVAVEDPGYAPARRLLASHGARLVPIPVDSRGLDVAALAQAAKRARIRAVMVTPQHQYPTMAVMAPERRLDLLALAARERFAVLEDDYDHEWHFDGRPIAPLASADRDGVVVYVGSLSKLLAPGLRIGFVVAPRDLLATLGAYRFLGDRQGAHASEAAVGALIEEGELERHVRRTRRVYVARRDAMVEGLLSVLGARIAMQVPAGGLALWPRWIEGSRTLPGIQRALSARGVRLDIGRDFTVDGRDLAHARVGFASLDDRERTLVLARLREATRSTRQRARS